MTPELIGGLTRAVIASAGGYAAAKGWLSAADVDWIAGGAVALSVSGWSWWAKRPAKSA